MAEIQWQMVGSTITVLISTGILQINRDHKYA